MPEIPTPSAENPPDRPGGHSTQQDAEASLIRSNRGVGIGLLIVIVFLGASIWFSGWAHRVMRDGFILGGFPLLAVGFMAVAALILVFDGQSRKIEPEVARLRLGAVITVLFAAGILGIAFLAMPWIGFVPMVALLVGGGGAFLGYRPVWSAFGVGVVAAAVLRVILWSLGIDIDDGVIWGLIVGAGNV